MRPSISLISMLVLAVHSFFAVLLQSQNAAISPNVGTADILGSVWSYLAVGVAIAAAYELMRRKRVLLLVFYPVFILILIGLVGNQFFYQIFQDSLTLSHLDEFKAGDAGAIAVSVRSEIGVYQFVNLTVLACTIIGFAFAEKRWHSQLIAPAIRGVTAYSIAFVALLLAMVLLALVQPASEQARRASSHILLSLWDGSNSPAKAIVRDEDAISPPALYKLQYGSALKVAGEQELLGRNRSTLALSKRNIMLVVLESVGSRQLLLNGVPRAEVAPFLNASAQHAMVFDTVTNQFPASTRSHVAINTGGLIPTWASVSSSLVHPYKGQTLVSAFKAAGWRTGLFSAAYLDYENLKSFYDRLGFDTVLLPDDEGNGLEAHANPDGWGIEEFPVLSRALDWVQKSKDPFFLQFLTISSHHPYVLPPSHAGKYNGRSNLEKYEDTLRYTDELLREMTTQLLAMGKDDTLIVIMGDHGEAFGDIHANNFTHKNYLFQENIGNFLMIIDLKKEIAPVASHRRASIADVMPTLIGLQGISPDPGLPGQDLLSPGYEERNSFFFKSAHPEQWGIRDGEWKFVVKRYDEDEFELYNLARDPDEKINLAGAHPDRLQTYEKLASNWYVMLNNAFVSKLGLQEGVSVPKLALADVAKQGLTEVAVGTAIDPLPFTKLARVHPEETLSISSYGSGFAEDTPVDYVFTSPSGELTRHTFLHEAGWVSVTYNEALTKKREIGTWKLVLQVAGKPVIETEFLVTESVPLIWSAFDRSPGVRFIKMVHMFGEETQVVESVSPRQTIELYVGLVEFSEKTIYSTVITGPGAKEQNFAFEIEPGWQWGRFPMPEGTFSTPGEYQVSVFKDGKVVASTTVTSDVDVSAASQSARTAN